MQIGEAARTSAAEIWSHKLRSALTLVGIVLGTTALVVMVSVIGGLAEAVQKGLSDLGFDGVVFEEEAIGREILIRGMRFRIVGVLKKFGNNQVQDGEMERDNMKIYIPLSTAQKYFVGGDTVHAWAFKADPEKMGDAQKEAEALMRRSHRGITDFKIENIGQEILRVRKEIDKLIVNWNIVLAAAFAIVIGLPAGVYPALRASRLTPVDAIRAG